MDTTPHRVRRRKGNTTALSVCDDRLTGQDANSENAPSESTEMAPLCIGDAQKVTGYYEGALTHFLQLNCRVVAKAFIKFIEPRKQVRHPYNGGSAPGTTGDPEKTRPEWWPSGVMHKEPDHLRKERMIYLRPWLLIYFLTLFSTDRIKLLIHIIRKLGSYGITADKLMDVAGDTKRSLKHPSHIEIIHEILQVRRMEERFERGEISADTVVYTMIRSHNLKGDEEDDSATSVAIMKPEHISHVLMNPTSSFEQASTSLTTPINNIPSGCSLPGRFFMAEPLNFENPARQGRPYYATPPQCSDSLSQSMLSTPMAAENISPHDVSVSAFDDSAHNTYPNFTLGVSGHYDTWTPSFRQNIFSPVDYATQASSQGMPQPLMNCQIPMVSHVHDMSHRHAQLPSMASIHQKSLSFCTGSLGHPHPNEMLSPAPSN